MSASPFAALRRRIGAAGGRRAGTPWAELPVPATGSPPPVDVIEAPFRHHHVGAPLPWVDDVAFLDGTQHVELVGYVGTDPLVAAVVRAAVRVRRDRRMAIATEASRRVVIARSHVLEQMGAALDGHDSITLPDADPRHPVHDLERAHAAVDDARGMLEALVARQFRAMRDCWLIADGTLGVSPDWATDPRMVGIVKTHGVLPLEGDMLDTWLTLPVACRTSVYAPRSQRVTPVYAWGLRLREWEGHDIFHGLIRVETAATSEALALADTLARHLLAERAPLASSPRADRLLYGIHDVSRYLRAAGASR
jgi:hypothetical protein